MNLKQFNQDRSLKKNHKLFFYLLRKKNLDWFFYLFIVRWSYFDTSGSLYSLSLSFPLIFLPSPSFVSLFFSLHLSSFSFLHLFFLFFPSLSLSLFALFSRSSSSLLLSSLFLFSFLFSFLPLFLFSLSSFSFLFLPLCLFFFPFFLSVFSFSPSSSLSSLFPFLPPLSFYSFLLISFTLLPLFYAFHISFLFNLKSFFFTFQTLSLFSSASSAPFENTLPLHLYIQGSVPFPTPPTVKNPPENLTPYTPPYLLWNLWQQKSYSFWILTMSQLRSPIIPPCKVFFSFISSLWPDLLLQDGMAWPFFLEMIP